MRIDIRKRLIPWDALEDSPSIREGKVTEVVEWFGYKLHLLVDVKHEVVLGYAVTEPNAGDGETLPTVLDQVQANLPEKRIETLAYDKARGTIAPPPPAGRTGPISCIRRRIRFP